ncbi:hypothetical protein M9H77_27294 [Catharanthus roseus]|uniref:Uncharacterized protein n=1 Tax=Catharanthus roseus TaxID=4058 RepID=A0ACC0AG75_CATRO|nr:hypothetical protein M9H77_27294 [Catharanthus roseus]
MAQVKDATERVNVAEGKIARLNTGKAKLDEIISVGRPAGMKSGLGYTSTNLNHTTGMRIGDLKQGRKLHTYALTKGDIKMRWIWIKKEELRGEQPIRTKRSLTLELDDSTLSPLASTRYYSLGLSSTTTSSATPITPIIRPINSLSLSYYLGSPDEFLLMCRYFLSLPIAENLGTEILYVDAHPEHHFIDKLSHIAVLPPLTVGGSINQSMEDINEGIQEGSEGEHNVEGKGSSRSDLEVVGLTPDTGLSQGRKRTRAVLKGASS